ncbi:MAG: M23 family metallopeptidase [Anaerolineae bacterium]|nr:M23 family metallopeptidase [Anaerolineae bacterium]
MFKFKISVALVLVLTLLTTSFSALAQDLPPEAAVKTTSYEDAVLGVQISYAPELRRLQDEYLFPAYGFTLVDQDDRLVLRVGWLHQATSGDVEKLAEQAIMNHPDLDIRKANVAVGGQPGIAVYPLPGIEPVTCIYVLAHDRVYEIFYGREFLDGQGIALLKSMTFMPAQASLADLKLPEPDGMDISELAEALSRSESGDESQDTSDIATTAGANCVNWPTSKFMRVPLSSSVNGTGYANAGPSYYGQGMHLNCNKTNRSNDYHALDFSMRSGDTILSPVSGTVVYFGWTYGGYSTYGRVVIIDAGGGYQYMAAHLKGYGSVAYPGQQISSGAVIGSAGGSGNQQDDYWSVHLHHVFYKNATFDSSGKAMYGGQGVEPRHVRYYRNGTKYYETITNGMQMSW